jgi:hypothetical protein
MHPQQATASAPKCRHEPRRHVWRPETRFSGQPLGVCCFPRWGVQGVDILRWNDQGKLVSFTVMVRPMRGLQKLTELMGRQLAAGQA